MSMEVKESSENHQQMLNDVVIITGQFDNSVEKVPDNLENINNASSINKNSELTTIENEKDIIINKNDNNKTESSDDKLNSVAGAQSPAALAFTIDFSDGKKDKNESIKYQNLFQRYNARHRRNVSTSKIEIKTSKSSTELSPNFVQKRKPLSEGYFSSEDDTKRKVDRLSQKLQELGLKTNTKGAIKKTDIMTRSLTENKLTKRHSYCDEEQTTSNKIRPEMSYSATMNDLSKIQKLNSNIDNDRSNCVQYSPEKIYTKNIEYININHEYDEIINHEMTEKLSNINYSSDNCSLNTDNNLRKKNKSQLMSVSFTNEQITNKDTENTNLDVFNVSNIDGSSDGTISEAGTYTIHKDYTDEEKSRMDIDKVFSVGILTEEESNESYVNHFKIRSTRDNNNTWIKEWATQVAEHNFLPSTTIVVGGGGGGSSSSTSGRTPPTISPSKIPSPIYLNSRRQNKSRYEQSDSSLDADIQEKFGLNNSNNNNINMIDSGGESDDDTSNSYPTPPHSSQRTPTHTSLVRRGSLTEALFKRVNNNNDGRRSMRKYPDVKIADELLFNMPKSPSHALTRLQFERSNSLDRKDVYSITPESNSSRRSSIRNYYDEHTNSPILNRLRSTTPKLTNSPILGHKKIHTNNIKSPIIDRPKQFINYDNNNKKSKNIDYNNTYMENSPYMLRKSNSTSNYHEITSDKNEYLINHGSPLFQRNNLIKRSSSNNSIRNTKTNNSLSARRDSFNDKNCEIKRKLKNKLKSSDSSSETGEIQHHQDQQLQQQQQQQKLQHQQQQQYISPRSSSGIKLNRAFSIRRGRLNNDSDTTLNTKTQEERRCRNQIEIKSAPTSARQSGNHYRGRTSSVGASNKDTFKKPEALNRQRIPSLSRTEGGRYSMRIQKTTNTNISTRTNQKLNRDGKNSGRSNSTLTSKEVEFQNWKRRKNYNPMQAAKAAAEGKKKLSDTPRKHHSIDDNNADCHDNSVLRSASFHGTRGILSLADDWSDNDNNFIDSNEILQIPPPSSPLCGSDSDLDTSSYLQTTHNVMSAMSARMNVYRSTLPVDSGGESDEDTSQSLRQTNKIHHQVSDTESSDDPQAINSTNVSKFNRSFGNSIRRGREIRETNIKTTQIKSQYVVSNNTRAKSESPSIKNQGNLKGKPKDKKQIMQQNLKEQEMQNWKRRKSYNPMQAAMMDSKRKASIKKNLTSESSSVLRSQSFHGPVNLGISEWSDEDISASADEAPIY